MLYLVVNIRNPHSHFFVVNALEQIVATVGQSENKNSFQIITEIDKCY